MNDKQYLAIGSTGEEYLPSLRLDFLKENLKEVFILNGHLIMARLYDGQEIQIGDCGTSITWMLTDIIVVLNKFLRENPTHSTL